MENKFIEVTIADNANSKTLVNVTRIVRIQPSIKTGCALFFENNAISIQEDYETVKIKIEVLNILKK